MATTSYTSRRGYLTQDELEQYADIDVTDATEADDQISQAEELIDAYVGPQVKAVKETIEGRVASATSTTITLEASRHQDVFQKNYFVYCELEIVGGTGIGQRKIITGSTYAGVLTVVSSWTTTPDSTSYYKIYQLGKFPRQQDEYFDGNVSPQIYVKSIPEAVKRAVAAQVEYMIKVGASMADGTSTLQSETIGDYSYSRGDGGGGSTNLIAPKAKQYLRGITNRRGVMIV